MGEITNVPVVLLCSTVPPQVPCKSSQLAPTPREPPFTVSVTGVPAQIVEGEAATDVGATDTLLMVTVVLTQAVVLQVPVPCT